MESLVEKLKQDIHYKEGLNSCMNCGVCTAICPAAEFYNYDPRLIADTVQRGNEEQIVALLKSETIWYCGECMSCKTRCPRGNTPGEIIMALRKLSIDEGYFVESEKGRQQYALEQSVGTSILNVGYCVTPDLVLPEKHPEQGPVWRWIYDNRVAFYPKVHSTYGKEGAGALRRIDEASLNELNEIFKVTGGTDFMEQIESCSMAKAGECGLSADEYFDETFTANNGSHNI